MLPSANKWQERSSWQTVSRKFQEKTFFPSIAKPKQFSVATYFSFSITNFEKNWSIVNPYNLIVFNNRQDRQWATSMQPMCEVQQKIRCAMVPLQQCDPASDVPAPQCCCLHWWHKALCMPGMPFLGETATEMIRARQSSAWQTQNRQESL